ncbi:hypothetical protein D5086_023527 [Populus alba]|uniref:Uncharacterized protein n=1 Tax=Populus alba TaxID=43335 RepID=A0ACC4BAQ2_POPAL
MHEEITCKQERHGGTEQANMQRMEMDWRIIAPLHTEVTSSRGVSTLSSIQDYRSSTSWLRKQEYLLTNGATALL